MASRNRHEPPIRSRPNSDEVDIAAQEILQAEQHAEVAIRQFTQGIVLEFHEKIEVAPLGVKVTSGRRADQLEPADGVRVAECRDLRAVLLDV